MRTLLAGSRSALGLTLAVVAWGVLALTGCSQDGGEPSGRADRKAGSRASAPATAPRREPGAVMANALLGAEQIGHGVKLQDDDDSLKPATNDVCGKRWATNTRRIARRQRFFWADAKAVDLVVSHEVAMYPKGEARDVLAEIEAAVADCDGWKHGQGRMIDPHLTDPPASASENALAWAATDDRQGTEFSYLAVYQVRGDVLTALYIWTTGSPSAPEIAGELTPKAAARLEGIGN